MDSDVDYDFYVKKGQWGFDDLNVLFAHLSDKEFNQLIELIHADIGAKKLKHRRTGSSSLLDGISYFFDPFTFIDWAIDKGIQLIPNKLIEWHFKQIKPEPEEVPSYLDPSHPLHSWELAVAISAWREVLESNPDKPNRGTRKSLVESWLKSHYPKLKQSEIDRITIMLNPDKAAAIIIMEC